MCLVLINFVAKIRWLKNKVRVYTLPYYEDDAWVDEDSSLAVADTVYVTVNLAPLNV
jgi:hypothetical protein